MNLETGSDSGAVPCQYISLKGLAELLGVSYETVRKWRARGELPHTIVLPNGQIRMSLADVDQWLEGRSA
jgi:excisionase family DNA binding protein